MMAWPAPTGQRLPMLLRTRYFDDWLESITGRCGIRPVVRMATGLDANHGRWTLPVIPTARPDMPHNWYATAQRDA
jgi:O-methyltransferase involved in polyketide biosynthesis